MAKEQIRNENNNSKLSILFCGIRLYDSSLVMI